jgi:hypothetical protein
MSTVQVTPSTVYSKGVHSPLQEDYWDFSFGDEVIEYFLITKFPQTAAVFQAKSSTICDIVNDPVYGPAITEELNRYNEFEAFEIVEIPPHLRKQDMVRFLWNF